MRRRSLVGRRLGTYEIRRSSARAGWARSIARATRSSDATSPSRSCRRRSRGSGAAARGSSARRGCWRRSIIRTSARSTASRTPTASARSSSSSSKGETLAERLRGGPLPVHEALDDRAADRRRARSGAREGHRPPRSQAGQHQDHARRRREGARLRPGEGRPSRRIRQRLGIRSDRHVGPDTRGADPRHRRVHEPRAGARQAGRQAHRHLGVRLRAV